jgi:beta-lactamase regulating signal transducer with metallopeptidase domain
MNQINIVFYIQIILVLIGLGLFGYGLYLIINNATNVDYKRKSNEDDKTYNDRKSREESKNNIGWILVSVGIGLIFIACILQLMITSKFFVNKSNNNTSSSEIISSDEKSYKNPLYKNKN